MNDYAAWGFRRRVSDGRGRVPRWKEPTDADLAFALCAMALGYSKEGAAALIGVPHFILFRRTPKALWARTRAAQQDTYRRALLFMPDHPDLRCPVDSAGCEWVKPVDWERCEGCRKNAARGGKPPSRSGKPAPKYRACLYCGDWSVPPSDYCSVAHKYAQQRQRVKERHGRCCGSKGHTPRSHLRCAPAESPDDYEGQAYFCGILAGDKHETKEADIDPNGRCPACRRAYRLAHGLEPRRRLSDDDALATIHRVVYPLPWLARRRKERPA